MYLDLRHYTPDTPLPERLNSFLAEDFHAISPFCPLLFDFCQSISQKLSAFDDPDIAALGFWLRAAHIHELHQRFNASSGNGRERVPRGLVFHVTASNVDTLFAYSWALALLCGNGNYVRLPSKQNKAIENILETIQNTLEMERFHRLDALNCFVHYGHQETITGKISAQADMRVLWGSNPTIHTIRQIPLNPYATEIAFPERFSYALIDTAHYLKLPPDKKRQLAQAFFRDVYGFDQNGCSSPRLIFWVGAAGFADAAADFSSCLQDEIRSRGYELPLSAFLNKQTQLYVAATALPVRAIAQPSNELTSVVLDHFHTACRHHPGGGLLYHVPLNQLAELGSFTAPQDQTAVYAGFDRHQLRAVVRELNGKGPSRFVPFGEALRFSADWDGHDLLHAFSKQCVCVG